jgi:hypothetical protein
MERLSTLILKNTVITYTILQLYIEPPSLALSAPFHLNCTYMRLEIADRLLLVSR